VHALIIAVNGSWRFDASSKCLVSGSSWCSSCFAALVSSKGLSHCLKWRYLQCSVWNFPFVRWRGVFFCGVFVGKSRQRGQTERTAATVEERGIPNGTPQASQSSPSYRRICWSAFHGGGGGRSRDDISGARPCARHGGRHRPGTEPPVAGVLSQLHRAGSRERMPRTARPRVRPQRRTTPLAAEASGTPGREADRARQYVEFTLTRPANAITTHPLQASPTQRRGGGIDAPLTIDAEREAQVDVGRSRPKYRGFYNPVTPFSCNDPYAGPADRTGG